MEQLTSHIEIISAGLANNHPLLAVSFATKKAENSGGVAGGYFIGEKHRMRLFPTFVI
jgi:hypothetical protein